MDHTLEGAGIYYLQTVTMEANGFWCSLSPTRKRLWITRSPQEHYSQKTYMYDNLQIINVPGIFCFEKLIHQHQNQVIFSAKERYLLDGLSNVKLSTTFMECIKKVKIVNFLPFLYVHVPFI